MGSRLRFATAMALNMVFRTVLTTADCDSNEAALTLALLAAMTAVLPAVKGAAAGIVTYGRTMPLVRLQVQVLMLLIPMLLTLATYRILCRIFAKLICMLEGKGALLVLGSKTMTMLCRLSLLPRARPRYRQMANAPLRLEGRQYQSFAMMPRLLPG